MQSSNPVFKRGLAAIENRGGTVVDQSTDELNNLYKEYFPNNKAELSYKVRKKRTTTKFFLNPTIHHAENIGLGIFGGVEIEY